MWVLLKILPPISFISSSISSSTDDCSVMSGSFLFLAALAASSISFITKGLDNNFVGTAPDFRNDFFIPEEQLIISAAVKCIEQMHILETSSSEVNPQISSHFCRTILSFGNLKFIFTLNFYKIHKSQIILIKINLADF